MRDEDPDNDHALYMLAVAHAQRGEHAEAIAHLERAIALNPENRALARRDPDLEPLREDERSSADARTSPPRGSGSAIRAIDPPPPRIRAEISAIIESGDAMSDLHIVVLAAGKGTRMKSALPKVLHRVGGRADDRHVLDRRPSAGAAIDDRRRWASGGRVRGRTGAADRPHVCGPGATARHRPRAADDRAALERRNRHPRAAVGRRAAAVAETL